MIPLGILATGGGIPAFSILSSDNNVQLAAGVTTYNVTGRSIGAAASDRIIIVNTAFATGAFAGNLAVTGATCNGVAMTPIKTPSATENADSNLWYALVPTGTTANFVFTVNGSTDERAGFVGFSRLTGYSSPIPTVIDTAATANEDVVLLGGDTIVSASAARANGNYIFTTSSMEITVGYNSNRIIGTDSHYVVSLLAHKANVSPDTYRSTPSSILSVATAQQNLYAVWR